MHVPELKAGEEVDGKILGRLRKLNPELDKPKGPFQPLDFTEDEENEAGVDLRVPRHG